MNTRPNAISRYPDPGAWAEMLARVWDKNARLGDAVARNWPRRGGANLLTELERERSRIARELHAGAGQPLAGIKLHLELLEGCTDAASARATIGQLQTLADQALSQVRAVSHRLHPPEWQEMTVDQAMESLVDSSGLGSKLQLTRDFQPLTEEPSHAVKVQMYRCAQECIANIIRHSSATEASLSLVEERGRLVLTVSDNGHGFDTGAKNSGIGLRAIAENAASIGGKSSITSSPEGTKIVVILPLSAD